MLPMSIQDVLIDDATAEAALVYKNVEMGTYAARKRVLEGYTHVCKFPSGESMWVEIYHGDENTGWGALRNISIDGDASTPIWGDIIRYSGGSLTMKPCFEELAWDLVEERRLGFTDS